MPNITRTEAIELLGQYVGQLEDRALWISIEARPFSMSGCRIVAVDETGVTYHHYNSNTHVGWDAIREFAIHRTPSELHGETGETWQRRYALIADVQVAA